TRNTGFRSRSPSSIYARRLKVCLRGGGVKIISPSPSTTTTSAAAVCSYSLAKLQYLSFCAIRLSTLTFGSSSIKSLAPKNCSTRITHENGLRYLSRQDRRIIPYH